MDPKALLTLSMKGVVGKTTTAVGLAKVLARRGHKVGLLDVDIHGSARPRALKLARDPGYEPLLGGRLRPVEIPDLGQVFSVGLLFRQESPAEWRGETKTSAVEQLVTGSIAWDKDLEWLVIDTPHTSGDEVLSLLKHTPQIHGAIIVTQPSDLSTLGMRKTVNLLAEHSTPIVGLLVNMSGFQYPKCHHFSTLFDEELDLSRQLCEELGIPHLGYILFLPEEQAAGWAGAGDEPGAQRPRGHPA